MVSNLYKNFLCIVWHQKPTVCPFLKSYIGIFDLVSGKSGLEFVILKFIKPLQSCCCPVQKSLPRKADLAWQVQGVDWKNDLF